MLTRWVFACLCSSGFETVCSLSVPLGITASARLSQLAVLGGIKVNRTGNALLGLYFHNVAVLGDLDSGTDIHVTMTNDASLEMIVVNGALNSVGMRRSRDPCILLLSLAIMNPCSTLVFTYLRAIFINPLLLCSFP